MPGTSDRLLINNGGYSLSFSGDGDHVLITADEVNLSTFTYVAWIKIDTLKQNTIRGDTKGSGTRAPKFRVNASGYLELLEQSVASIGTSTGTIPLNKWTHVAVNYDAGGNYVFFINGQEYGSGTNLRSFEFGDMQIGSSADADEDFSGLMDDFRLYNTALSQSQIEQIYLTGEVAVTPRLFFKFDEGSGSVAIDSSGDDREAIIIGATYSSDTPSVVNARSAVSNKFKIRDMGTSLSFDGSDDYVYKNSAGVYGASGYSVEMWVKGSPTNDTYFYSEANSATNTQYFSLRASVLGVNKGRVSARLVNNAGTVLLNSVNGTIIAFDGNWHHIVWVDDGGSCQLYVDGVLDSTDFDYTPVGSFTFNRTSVGALYRTTASAFCKSKFDQVRTWSVALTQEEVTNLYLRNYKPSIPELEWLFDEGSGSSATDSSGNGNTGTISGATYLSDVPLRRRFKARDMKSSLKFDGSNDVVTVANHADLQITGDFTLGCWLNLDSYANNASLISKFANDNNCEYHWRINQTSGVFYLQQGSGSGQLNYTGASKVPLHKWVHVVVVKNSSNVTYYIDGVAGTPLSTSATVIVSTNADVYLGGRNDSSLYLPGKMREAFICNEDLTQSEIRSIFYDGDYPSSTKMVLRMDEKYGTSLADDSGNSHVGTVNGAAFLTDVPLKSRNTALKDYIKSLSGLVVYYPMDEQSGRYAFNEAPDTYGTFNGVKTGATQNVPGLVGGAYSFDGNGDRVAFGDIPALSDATALSVFALINCANITQDHYIFGNISTAANGFFLYADDVGFETSRTNTFKIFVQSTSASHIEGTSELNEAGIWKMVGFTFIASTTTNGLKLYVDGVLDRVASTEFVSNAGQSNNSINTGESHAGSLDANASIQHIMAFNRVLTQEEITKLAQLAELA